jgi:hypothetical protein
MRLSSYMPPSLVSLRVIDQGRTKFRLWLPLFLLWLVLLPLFLVVLVLTLLGDLLTLPLGNRFGFTRMVFGVLGVMSAARGTEVHIDTRDPKNPDLSVAFTLK